MKVPGESNWAAKRVHIQPRSLGGGAIFGKAGAVVESTGQIVVWKSPTMRPMRRVPKDKKPSMSLFLEYMQKNRNVRMVPAD